MLFAPKGYFASEDAAARKRKKIAERLKKGEEVAVTSSGQVVDLDDPQAEPGKGLVAPEGKLE